MNQGFIFTKGSRYHKAQLIKLADSKFLQTILLLVSIGGVAGGALLFAAGIKPGLSLMGLAIIPAMIRAWLSRDILRLDVRVPKNTQSNQIDQLVSADILVPLSAATAPKAIWESLANYWQHQFFINRFGIDHQYVASQLSAATADSTVVWRYALQLRDHYGQNYVAGGMLTVAVLLTSPIAEQYLRKINLVSADILRGLDWQVNIIKQFERGKTKPIFGGIGRDFAAGFTPIIDQFSYNISHEIEKGNLIFSSAGRENLIAAMEAALARPQRNSVVLVGEVGVGKTELVHSFASHLIRGESTSALNYDQIAAISITAINDVISKGYSLEELISRMLTEAVHAKNMILFLDEAQLFFGNQPGAVDISQILLPIVQQSRVRLIMAMSSSDWHRLTSLNSSLSQLFTKIEVGETNEALTIQILGDISISLEYQSKKFITYKALVAAYRLAARYMQGTKAFPARAIDLLEDSLNYAEGQVVTENSIASAVEAITNTKVAQAGAQEKAQLLNLEKAIHQRMINQTQAVEAVSNALRRLRAGVRDPKRPAGSFLFLGPTGVGKTELARSLAAVYFGREANMIRLDMSEYQSRADVARLLQAVGRDSAGSGFLRIVARQPFSVILLDEIEKAHPDVLNLLMQMLDEGHLTDSAGVKVNFKEAIIICTSNAGADEIHRRVGSGQPLDFFERELIDDLINKRIFRPELINRYDAVVLFRPLKQDELKRIAMIMLDNVNKTLAAQGITVNLTDAALSYLAEIGYDPRFGARPMRRAIQDLVENNVAQKILQNQIATGSTITLDQSDLTAGTSDQGNNQAISATNQTPGSLPPPKAKYR